MNKAKWQRMEDILDKYHIKPLVGIIPANADPQTMIESENPQFWAKAHNWEQKGWSMALHGYDHVCISDGGMKGLNPFWKRSEFAGLTLAQQREKIKKGYSIMKEKGFEPKYFFAPSHTFDENTLVALSEETSIRSISDTIALRPYMKSSFTFIPQITGHCVEFPFSGVYTFCFHPNTMNDDAYFKLEAFLKGHADKFVAFDDLKEDVHKRRKLIDLFFSWAFFTYRILRGLS